MGAKARRWGWRGRAGEVDRVDLDYYRQAPPRPCGSDLIPCRADRVLLKRAPDSMLPVWLCLCASEYRAVSTRLSQTRQCCPRLLAPDNVYIHLTGAADDRCAASRKPAARSPAPPPSRWRCATACDGRHTVRLVEGGLLGRRDPLGRSCAHSRRRRNSKRTVTRLAHTVLITFHRFQRGSNVSRACRSVVSARFTTSSP